MVIDMIGLVASVHLGIRAERGPLGADNGLRRVRLQTPDKVQQPMREREAVGLQTRKARGKERAAAVRGIVRVSGR